MKSIVLFFFIIPLFLHSQNRIENEALSSSGDQFEGTDLKLDWTLGENAAETIGMGNVNLTQGFQQGEHTYTTFVVTLDPSYSFSVFPNPTSSKLTLEGPVDPSIHLRLIDASGKILQTSKINQNKTEIDVSTLISGLYLIVIYKDQRIVQWIKIHKI